MQLEYSRRLIQTQQLLLRLYQITRLHLRRILLVWTICSQTINKALKLHQALMGYNQLHMPMAITRSLTTKRIQNITWSLTASPVSILHPRILRVHRLGHRSVIVLINGPQALMYRLQVVRRPQNKRRSGSEALSSRS